MQTREQMVAERNARERDAAMARRAAQNATLAAYRQSGAVELVVCNPRGALRDALPSLGYALVAHLTNRWARVCRSPAEIDAARDPIAVFFDRAGNEI